jgi:PDZ domain-containing secreted protein
MKQILVILAAVLLTQFSLSNAQQMKIITSGDVEFMPEINGVVVHEKDKFILNLNIPADMRSKEYQNVDLQNGDEIQFVNGKKIKTIKDFKNMYTETKSGNEVKFGVMRNGQRFIVAFKKGTIKEESVKSGENKNKIQVINGKVFINGKEANIDSLKKAGVNVIIKKGKGE